MARATTRLAGQEHHRGTGDDPFLFAHERSLLLDDVRLRRSRLQVVHGSAIAIWTLYAGRGGKVTGELSVRPSFRARFALHSLHSSLSITQGIISRSGFGGGLPSLAQEGAQRGKRCIRVEAPAPRAVRAPAGPGAGCGPGPVGREQPRGRAHRPPGRRLRGGGARGPAIAGDQARGSEKALANPSLQRFFAFQSDAWEVRWDTRSDRPNLIQGAGIPLLPGRGNRLALADLKLAHAGPPQVADVEAQGARLPGRVPRAAERGGLRPAARSGGHRPGRRRGAALARGAPAVPPRRAGGGGQGLLPHQPRQRRPARRRAGRRGADEHHAEDRPRGGAGGRRPGSGAHGVRRRGDPRPRHAEARAGADRGRAPAEAYRGAPGRGYRHLLVWEVELRRAGDPATWAGEGGRPERPAARARRPQRLLRRRR